MLRVPGSTWLAVCFLLLPFWAALARAVSSEKPLMPLKKAAYSPGQAIPVSCLNRTIDTGEHHIRLTLSTPPPKIEDSTGQLQYIPFPTCNETGQPLELYFGIEGDSNCTIPFITDEFYHLLEFYIHNDAPLTCRIPSRPLIGGEHAISASPSAEYIPLVFALSGQLQRSHMHVAANLNLIMHAAPRSRAPGVIDSSIAYSIAPLSRSTKIIIGAALPLRLRVRWYPSNTLPAGWRGVGGHLYFSTLVYCLLSAGAAAAVCVAYFRGVELPKRLRAYGGEKLSVERGTYNGYAYGVGNGVGVGNAWGGNGSLTGKRD
ncbi:MAG: hypothetical protein M1829_006693 [Trizodia sp. TS-e1964]|nr:MAG: hypothetical protein M1829_006693 [Trizodia sp. TS-e1964]